MSRSTSSSWRLPIGGWPWRRSERSSCPLPTGHRQPRTGQEGFTLSALIVLLTIMSIIIAYTVPTQWSLVMKRERERQTIFLMKQYARGIANWERKHNSLPVSLQQLQDARQPRMLRGTGKWANPLTGREDGWILVPPNAIEAVAGAGAIPPPAVPTGARVGVGTGAAPQPSAGAPGTGPSKLNAALSPADYVGPFVAVRPNASGKSMITLNGAEDYSQWVYTVQDLKMERLMRQTMRSQRQQ